MRSWPESITLRPWQERALQAFLQSSQSSFLLVACPGSGKTIPALRMAHEGLSEGTWQRVIIACPTEHLKVQWDDAAHSVGIRINREWSNGMGVLTNDFDGVVVTFAQIASNPQAVRSLCRVRTFGIGDEIHHAGNKKSWGEGYRIALEPAMRRVLLSGTPFGQIAGIPFVDYPDGKLRIDFPYHYGEALSDGFCRPIYFPTWEGKERWYHKGKIHEATFRDELSEDDAARRLKTALMPEGDWIKEVIIAANKQLTDMRHDHPDAAGLVVAMDINAADRIAHQIKRLTGEDSTVVHTDEDDSSRLIKAFRKSRQRWIVSVKMVSEGVDIPRLRVGIYATNITTELFFLQFIGRFLRMIHGLEKQYASCHVPRCEAFIEMIERLQIVREYVLNPPSEEEKTGDDFGDDDDGKTRISTFVPLSSTGEADDVFHHDGISINQNQIIEAQQIMRETFAPTGTDPSFIARVAMVSRGLTPQIRSRPEQPSATTREATIKTTTEQRKELCRTIQRLVGRIVKNTDSDYDEIHTKLIKLTGTVQDQRTIEQLQRCIAFLEQWIGSLSS